MKFKKSFAENLKESFKADVPLTIHWDGKMMSDICGRHIVNRVPVVITRYGINQLLSVSKIASGTGENLATAIYNAIQDWNISENIKSLCFDTTSSYTGLKKGACTLIEQKLECPLLYLACCHHILDILLECMFSNYFGSSSGPDNILFQRFKTEWANINQEKFQNNYFEGDLQTKQEVTSFCLSKLEEMHARDDYKELLQLALITLGTMPCTSNDNESYQFIALGATH